MHLNKINKIQCLNTIIIYIIQSLTIYLRIVVNRKKIMNIIISICLNKPNCQMCQSFIYHITKYNNFKSIEISDDIIFSMGY